ncbi:MAG: hypothetical protein WCE45_09370 [Sedimentisphaerales bacterium]
MLPDKVKVLTIPLFPYLKPGRKKLQPTKRIRPVDSLNLKKMIKEIDKSAITTLDIDGKPWSVVSVYSSYSPDIHVMLVETSSNRYLAGPERVPDSEGNSLMAVWAAILEFIAARKTNVSIHAGYNWSPRSWGQEEEKTGFQSLPTKWHPHIWGWPSLNTNKSTKQKYVKSVKSKLLMTYEKRLLGDNDYSEPFGKLIYKKILKTFKKDSLLFKLFPYKNWLIDGRGIYAASNFPLLNILKHPKFFSRVLKPLAVLLEQLTGDLTEILTDIKCKEIDKTLIETEKGIPKNWKMLRDRPIMQSADYIRRQFKKRGYPESFLDAVLGPVKNRCDEKGNPCNWWRKGFGYALVLRDYVPGKCGEIRIMPAVYVGPGGVVEAQGIILKRPENRQLSDKEIRSKSKLLWQLAQNCFTFQAK